MKTILQIFVALLLMLAIVGQVEAANYMYEKASVKGTGYMDYERIISTQTGFNGVKLVEKGSGSGNVISDKWELEAERQMNGDGSTIGNGSCAFPNGITNIMDYINFTKEAEFEYMPISYQTGTYDQKWVEKLCVQNYRIGAVMTEMYSHAEHLAKSTEVKTRAYQSTNGQACCTGVLEATVNSNVIGVAHIGWISRDPEPSTLLKGRHAEYGRSVDDMTGVFAIEKFIQLWGNSTCGKTSVDWLPCV